MFPNRMTGRAASAGRPVAWMCWWDAQGSNREPRFHENTRLLLVLFKKEPGRALTAE
jgi:hypothetical protein